MAKPLIVFADPETATIDYLTGVLAGRDEEYLLDADGAPATISTGFPTGEPGAPNVPHLQVELDGTPAVDWPARERATIRTTWWTDGARSDAKAAMALIGGLLAAHPGDDRLWNILPLTGRLVDVDKETGLLFATATFRASTRPTQLAQ